MRTHNSKKLCQIRLWLSMPWIRKFLVVIIIYTSANSKFLKWPYSWYLCQRRLLTWWYPRRRNVHQQWHRPSHVNSHQRYQAYTFMFNAMFEENIPCNSYCCKYNIKVTISILKNQLRTIATYFLEEIHLIYFFFKTAVKHNNQSILMKKWKEWQKPGRMRVRWVLCRRKACLTYQIISLALLIPILHGYTFLFLLCFNRISHMAAFKYIGFILQLEYFLLFFHI